MMINDDDNRNSHSLPKGAHFSLTVLSRYVPYDVLVVGTSTVFPSFLNPTYHLSRLSPLNNVSFISNHTSCADSTVPRPLNALAMRLQLFRTTNDELILEDLASSLDTIRYKSHHHETEPRKSCVCNILKYFFHPGYAFIDTVRYRRFLSHWVSDAWGKVAK